MALATKVDLPRAPINYSDEYTKFNSLRLKNTSLTSSGSLAYTSLSSGIVYTSTTGEIGLLALIQTAIQDSLINAGDYNAIQTELDTKTEMTNSTNTIPITGWVENTGDYVYKLDLAVVEILSTDTLMISINKDDVDVKNDADMPDAETYDGGIRFFAKNIPTATIGFSYTRLR